MGMYHSVWKLEKVEGRGGGHYVPSPPSGDSRRPLPVFLPPPRDSKIEEDGRLGSTTDQVTLPTPRRPRGRFTVPRVADTLGTLTSTVTDPDPVRRVRTLSLYHEEIESMDPYSTPPF